MRRVAEVLSYGDADGEQLGRLGGLIERARAGDREALNALLARYRDRLRRMVELRLDRRLQARIDASDVIQEAYVEVVDAAGRVPARSEATRCFSGCG